MANEFRDQLMELDACDSALRWIDDNNLTTLEEAWAKCPRGDWMRWFLNAIKLGDPYRYPCNCSIWNQDVENCPAARYYHMTEDELRASYTIEEIREAFERRMITISER